MTWDRAQPLSQPLLFPYVWATCLLRPQRGPLTPCQADPKVLSRSFSVRTQHGVMECPHFLLLSLCSLGAQTTEPLEVPANVNSKTHPHWALSLQGLPEPLVWMRPCPWVVGGQPTPADVPGSEQWKLTPGQSRQPWHSHPFAVPVPWAGQSGFLGMSAMQSLLASDHQKHRPSRFFSEKLLHRGKIL